MRNVFLLAVFCSCAWGCGSDNSQGSEPNVQLTLAEACQQSCEAQSALHCTNGSPTSTCVKSCNDLPMYLPKCKQAWLEINACMASAPLFCDGTQSPAVSTKDCGDEIDAFMACN